jgi:hypothetical protein
VIPSTLPKTFSSAAPSVWRRHRTWIVLGGISIGWKIIVFTLGAAMPRWVIGDGIAHLPPAQHAHALQAKTMALPLYHPLERFGIVRALRVMQVDSTSTAVISRSPAGEWNAEATPCLGVGATVRAYTFFAIPYSQARLGCGTGVVEYRVFRRRS